MSNRQLITENLDQIRRAIEAACSRAGRSPDSIQLVAVTKYADLDWVRDLIEIGETQLGESRPQQMCQRVAELPEEASQVVLEQVRAQQERGRQPAEARALFQQEREPVRVRLHRLQHRPRSEQRQY